MRRVIRVVRAMKTLEGEGFEVARPFPVHGFHQFDPFLLLDEMGPMELKPGEAKGAPDHPHRGFETVTYLLSGEFEHEDSRGHRGKLNPGDVQWMTAASGVVHSEMPSRAFQERGGRLHGFQLWVNLPKASKMIAPRYQEIPSAKIPEFRSEDGKVLARVIAGESHGVKSVIDTVTPIAYLHFKLKPGARTVQAIDPSFNVFAYVISGEASFGSGAERIGRGSMVIFADDGGDLGIENAGSDELELLVIGGKPLREPVARYGPFVMNTADELEQAFRDYRDGKMGEIAR